MRPRAELHLHTHYSFLDGVGKSADYVSEAKRIGVTALAITDHGVLCGVHEHYRACRAAEIEPVLGWEAYFVDSISKVRTEKDRDRNHLTVLARGERGYRILKELNDEAQRNFYGKPLVDRKMVRHIPAKDRKYLYILSGCAGSTVSQLVLAGDLEAAEEELRWWRRGFLHYAIEIQHHGTQKDTKLTRNLCELAESEETEVVATNDCHYVHEEEESAHDALLAIQTAADIDDPSRFRFDGTGYHLRDSRRMRRELARAIDPALASRAIANSLAIARSCRTRIPAWEGRSWHIPHFPGVEDAQRELVKLTKRGLSDRNLLGTPAYDERAKHELSQLKKVGMADFLLICQDQMNHARSNGIPTGPGRGSVAGSLVGYALGIHKVDPIRADTKFERFVNPERPKLPDVDSDFAPWGRDVMFDYLRSKYGADNVLPVAAFQTMKLKATFKKLARAHGLPWPEANRVSKLLDPNDLLNDEEDTEDSTLLPVEVDETYPELAHQIRTLLGVNSAISTHPAGVVIFDPDDPDDVKGLVPLMWVNKQKRMASAFTLHSIEKIGCIKMDELGLRTLQTIHEAVKLIEARHGVRLDPDSWVPDEEPKDSKVYEMLAKGLTAGVFQMEGGANTRGIQEMRCSSFEDIVACTALYRAGPLGAGADKRYLKNKRSGRVRVAHPKLKTILSKTWGEMIYQEQMMDICHELAGFSWIETDEVKETVRFKDPKRMATFKDKFVQGCQDTSNIDPDSALKIWAMIEAQSTYLFNRSHAYAYSLVSYQTARLKRLYPLEYMTAYLATVAADNDSHKRNRKRVMSEAYDRGIRIVAPDINLSSVRMTCEKGLMRFGFADIRGIGESRATTLVERRPEGGYRSPEEVRSVTDKRTYDALEGCGALESIGGAHVSPRTIEDYVDWTFSDRMVAWRKRYRDDVKFPSVDGSYCAIVGELVSVESKTTKTGKPFRAWRIRWDNSTEFSCNLWSECEPAWNVPVGSIVAVEGKFSKEFNNVSVNSAENMNVLAVRASAMDAS